MNLTTEDRVHLAAVETCDEVLRSLRFFDEGPVIRGLMRRIVDDRREALQRVAGGARGEPGEGRV